MLADFIAESTLKELKREEGKKGGRKETTKGMGGLLIKSAVAAASTTAHVLFLRVFLSGDPEKKALILCYY